MASESKHIPADLLIDLLCRLPVKSLFRCMCVCKTWHHLIRTPSFVKIHLNYQKASSNTNKYILYQDSHLCTLLTDSEQLFGFTKSKLYYTPRSFDMHIRRLFVHGVCDGLICLTVWLSAISDMYLWNPICRKVKKLPNLKISSFGTTSTPPPFICGVGFGYYDDDYKVVVIAHFGNKYVVSVYSLSSNTWNVIRTNFHCKHAGSFRDTKFVGGTTYTMTSRNTIVCFQLCDETIRVFDFPEEFSPAAVTAVDMIRIEAYEETVALLSCDSGYFYMWILRDKSSSTSSWEKKFRVQFQKIGIHKVVGFLNNGKYLVRTLSYPRGLNVKLFWCDLDFPKLTEFRSMEVRESSYHAGIHANCTESLFLLDEDRIDPFVHSEMESFCSSMLLILRQDYSP
ncbi:F-box protein CPR1-like [Apium graveolens]|uniref:F-box protein CPR1-like n=1 Tax=Apium graveolens TaxID=4045 RepID=UPI003D7927C4